MKYSKGDGVYWTGIVAGKSTGRIPYYILKVIPNDDSETLYLLDDGYPGKVVPEHELVLKRKQMDNHSITTCDGTIYPKTKKELINTLEQIVKDIDNVYISFICSQEEAEREFC